MDDLRSDELWYPFVRVPNIQRLAREGVTTFVEVGPGSVLSGLVRKIAKGARVLTVDSPESLETTAAALAGGAEG